MRVLRDYHRVGRLITEAIKDLDLNLKNITVLTEAASGPFVVTPLIAAMAGAEKVIAVTRDSRYGLAEEVRQYTSQWMRELAIPDGCIEISTQPAIFAAERANLVTNLGFLRPISADFIRRLPKYSAISLMWETWEYRESDVDLQACANNNIPVLGTNERHERLQTFRYVGFCALKLLLEANIEVLFAKVLVIGSGFFGEAVESVLKDNGARVLRLNPEHKKKLNSSMVKGFIEDADACIVCEHHLQDVVVGGKTGIPIAWFNNPDIVFIHICGNIQDQAALKLQTKVVPQSIAPFGFMSVATDYLGPRPVIDLHTAGLKVGQELIEGMRIYGTAHKAKQHALQNSLAMDF